MQLPLSDIFKAGGGVTALARSLNKSHGTLLGWKVVPAQHVREVERITDIPRHMIRSDLYDPPSRRTRRRVSAPVRAGAPA